MNGEKAERKEGERTVGSRAVDYPPRAKGASTRSVLLATLAALVVLGLAGCGDDGKGSGSAFQEQVAAACRKSQARAEKAMPQNPPPDAPLTRANVEEVAAALEGFASDVRALKPPDDLADATNRFVNKLDGLAAEFRAVARDNATEQGLFAAVQPLFGRFDALEPDAKALGLEPLDTCGGTASAPTERSPGG